MPTVLVLSSVGPVEIESLNQSKGIQCRPGAAVSHLSNMHCVSLLRYSTSDAYGCQKIIKADAVSLCSPSLWTGDGYFCCCLFISLKLC